MLGGMVNYVPTRVNNRLRLIDAADAEGQVEYAEETARRDAIQKRRMYLDGDQYDAQNQARRADCNLAEHEPLPEHERKHPYSAHIEECVRFVTDQLADAFQINCDADSVQEIVDDALRATDVFTAGDQGDIVCNEVLYDASIAGDVAYEVRFDPVEQQCFLDVWESEQVYFENPYGQHVSKVTRDELIWVTNEAGERRQVTEHVAYALQTNPAGQQECRRDTYWDQDEEPRASLWLGVPFIPWGLLRANKDGLRSFRGSSAISDKAMGAADRYNSVEQLSFLIARYNSHGNLGVVGDGAMLQVEREGGVHKDVADVIRFPGGTSLVPITLPTDPQMIEHQQNVLADSIYQTFGLVRVEPDTIGGLGGVSGYALEILNRKAEGTLTRVRRQWQKDVRTMVDMIVDRHVYGVDAQYVAVDEEEPDRRVDLDADDLVEEGMTVSQAFDTVDPYDTYPERGVEIRLGSAYIVDQVALRDDYTAGLVSRREALRERGYSDDKIDEVLSEINEEKPAEGTRPSTGAQQAAEQVINAGANVIRDTSRNGQQPV